MLRRLRTGLLIGGLLLSFGLHATTVTAAAPSPSSPDRLAPPLTPPAVAFELRYGASPSPLGPRRNRTDPWLGRDKALHVAGSALWTLSTQYVLVNKAGWTEGDALPVSIASAATVGITKEILDTTRPTGTASGRDLAANAVGIALAAGLIVL